MRKILILSAVAATLSAPAFASEYCTGGSHDQWMSRQQITEKAEAMGYQVRQVKTEDGCFEVKAVNENGARFEIYFDPVTGEVVKTERES